MTVQETSQRSCSTLSFHDCTKYADICNDLMIQAKKKKSGHFSEDQDCDWSHSNSKSFLVVALLLLSANEPGFFYDLLLSLWVVWSWHSHLRNRFSFWKYRVTN